MVLAEHCTNHATTRLDGALAGRPGGPDQPRDGQARQRELDSGEVQSELDEAADGEVSARWSDGIECRLPPGKVLGEGRCTCASTELCRHLVRTVLAYQRRAALVSSPDQETPGTIEPAGPWDPGQIGDDVLAAAFKPTVLTRARAEFQQGLLVELVRSAKPSAGSTSRRTP